MLRFNDFVTMKFSENVTMIFLFFPPTLLCYMKEVFTLDKKDVLDLLSKKLSGELVISYDHLATLTNYSKRQLIRLSKSLIEKGIDSTLKHGNKGLPANNRASNDEIDFIVNFKKLYPNITIAQFRDIYLEDIIFNPSKKEIVSKYNLKPRSISFFQRLYREYKWSSPVKHKSHKRDSPLHLLREKSPRAGMLIQIDGTPFDWFGNGQLFTLHMAVDDATNDILAGWFTKNECMYGYCKMMELLIKKKGIPLAIYSDKHTIFKSPEGNITSFGLMMDKLGIEMIYANTSQAKGLIERYNGTAQRRLPNDIIRFNIKDYDHLNIWFNDFYIEYLNEKFAHLPIDPFYEYVEIPEGYDLSLVFTISNTRKIVDGNMFSYNGYYYLPKDKNGEVVKIRTSTEVIVLYYVLENKIRMKYIGTIYDCTVRGTNHKNRQVLIKDHKDLNNLIHEMDEKTKGSNQ